VPADIDILIGTELFWQLLCVGQIRSHRNQPILQKTQVSWIVGGKMHNREVSYLRACNLSVNQELNKALTKFWDAEHIITQLSFTPEEKLCTEHFTKTFTTRNKDERFVVRMPVYDTKLQQLGESKDTALKRFILLERRLHKQPVLKEQYTKFMTEYLSLGHMARINE